MITIHELNPNNYLLTLEQERNFNLLFDRLNLLRSKYGHPMIITSGVRSLEDQARINPSAMGSAHVKAAAADIADPDRRLGDWLIDNIGFCEQTGLWMEDLRFTPRWIHIQIIPPKSGNRIFIPC